MSRQEDFIDAGIAYRMEHGKPMCIAGSNLADVERDFNRVISFEAGAEYGYQYAVEKEEVKAMVKTIHDLREKISLLGWHPVTEPPKDGDEVVVITLGDWTAARAIYINGIYYSVVLGRKAYYPSVEWWCYPPEKKE